MARKIRIEYAGAAYDVMAGGVLKELKRVLRKFL